MKINRSGFTILELLVVVSLMAIMTAVVIGGMSESQQQSRDTKRKADLRLVQNAVELFRNKYGYYPSGCNASTTNTNTSWSGEVGTGPGRECTSGSAEYIVNLAPEFIPELPRDPRAGAGGNQQGYVYTTNTEGSVYKFMALDSVETETVDLFHDFYRCDKSYALGGTLASSDTWLDAGMCFRNRSQPNGGINQHIVQFSECTQTAVYDNDYAVSGGFSRDDRGANISADKGREYDTEIVRCK